MLMEKSLSDTAKELCKNNNKSTQNSTMFLSYMLQHQHCIKFLARFYTLILIMDSNVLRTLMACAPHSEWATFQSS